MNALGLIRAMQATGIDDATILKAVIAAEEERLAKGRARTAKCRNNNRNRDVTNVTNVTSPVVSPKINSNPFLPLRFAQRAPALPDARTMLFESGLPELAALTGKPPTKLRPLLGRWLRDTDDDALRILTLIAKARQDRPVEPIPWIERHLRPTNGATKNGQYPPLTDIRKAF
jgi:hypothetical protein